MQRNSLTWFERVLHRSRRSVMVILAGGTVIGVMRAYLGVQLSGDLTQVGVILIILGVGVMILFGLPLLLMRVVAVGGFMVASAGRRRELRRWAEQHGWLYLRRLRREDGYREMLALSAVAERHDTEIGLRHLLPGRGAREARPLRRRTRAMAIHVDELTQMTFTMHRMVSPEARRRFVAVQNTFDLPAVSLIDRRLTSLWEQPDSQVESVHFNERYCLRAADKQTGHAMVHPRVMALLLQAPPAIERVDLASGWTIFWLAPGARTTDIEYALWLAPRLEELVPGFLRDRRR